MEDEKREILAFLKTWSGQFVSAKEICRRAGGKRRYRDNPRWALPILPPLVEEGLIEKDSTGHYRLKPEKREKSRRPRWIAPQLARILKASGKSLGEFQVMEIYPQLEPDETSSEGTPMPATEEPRQAAP
jgi:hypothetical protein